MSIENEKIVRRLTEIASSSHERIAQLQSFLLDQSPHVRERLISAIVKELGFSHRTREIKDEFDQHQLFTKMLLLPYVPRMGIKADKIQAGIMAFITELSR